MIPVEKRSASLSYFYHPDKYERNKARNREYARNHKADLKRNHDNFRAKMRADFVKGDYRRIQKYLWNSAKQRAKREKLPFTIKPEDIIISTACPMLGIALMPSTKRGPNPNSPTVDRLIPSEGYTPENVWVISAKANTMKNSAILTELLYFKNVGLPIVIAKLEAMQTKISSVTVIEDKSSITELT